MILPPLIVTDAVFEVIDTLTPSPIKFNDVAFPCIFPSSNICNCPPAELILVSKDAESALYSELEKVCNKPTEVLILAVNVFVDCVYALNDAVVTKLPVLIVLPNDDVATCVFSLLPFPTHA